MEAPLLAVAVAATVAVIALSMWWLGPTGKRAGPADTADQEPIPAGNQPLDATALRAQHAVSLVESLASIQTPLRAGTITAQHWETAHKATLDFMIEMSPTELKLRDILQYLAALLGHEAWDISCEKLHILLCECLYDEFALNSRLVQLLQATYDETMRVNLQHELLLKDCL